MPKVMIVDDDTAIANLVGDALSDEGIESEICRDGKRAYDVLRKNSDKYDLVLFDIMMPGMDGLEVCRKIRETVACPIIFVTARNKTIDTVVGLEMGADDYIGKPFRVEELVARVKAHIRRSEREAGAKIGRVITCGDISIDTDSFEVTKHKSRIELTSREFQLLQFLMENEGRVLSREKIFDKVWGIEYADIGTVAVNIKNLRSKIDPENRRIITVWGVGYKFVGDDRQNV